MNKVEQLMEERDGIIRQKAALEMELDRLKAERDFSPRQTAKIKEYQRGIQMAQNDLSEIKKELAVERFNSNAQTRAKLSERKTVHEWLNMIGIPKDEDGRPICLLRRLRIALLERDAKTA